MTVKEVADKWVVTEQHIINLIENGKLAAVNIAGKFEFVRVPKAAIDELARRFKTSPDKILEILRETPLERVNGKRTAYRIPVWDGYEKFMQENSNRQ